MWISAAHFMAKLYLSQALWVQNAINRLLFPTNLPAMAILKIRKKKKYLCAH